MLIPAGEINTQLLYDIKYIHCTIYKQHSYKFFEKHDRLEAPDTDFGKLGGH